MAQQKTIKLIINRDPVCAADDVFSNKIILRVLASDTIGKTLEKIHAEQYLPRIQGGNATWIICASPDGKDRMIGVTAQEWSHPKLLVSPRTAIADFFQDSAHSLYFLYWLNVDPLRILACLQEGKTVPDRYNRKTPRKSASRPNSSNYTVVIGINEHFL